ncbi:MAG TPA: HEAT repeat domain-containing protein [Spirochaetota bacterium]|nr:HEAT repeat domain-containing protein [Spirochaetota bacterium]
MTGSIKIAKITAALLIIISMASSLSAMDQKEIVKAVLKGKSPDYESAIDYIKINHPPFLPKELKDEYLDDNDEDIRGRILTALILYPPEQIAPFWIEILKETRNTPLEIRIIDHLGRNKYFTPVIAEKLLAPKSEVRERAALSLKNSGDDRILPVILNLGRSSKPIDRIYLLEALKHLYDIRFQRVVLSFLDDENKSVRIYALKCATDNEIRESIPVIKRLVTKDDNDEVRKRSIEALVLFKDTGSGFIIASVLKEGKKELSLAALRALGELKYSNAAGPVSEILLKETDNEIKSAAIDALSIFGRAGNIEGLKHIITKDKDPLLRIKAIHALGEVNEERTTMDTLSLSLADRDYRIRGESCSAMGKLKRSRPSPILLNQIKSDNSRYVRSAALYSLEKIKDEKDIIPLFDIYSVERDPVFRHLLKVYLRSSINKMVR